MATLPCCVDDLEKLASKTILPEAFRFYASASDEKLTLLRNREIFQRILIKSNVLSKSVANIDMSVTLFDGTKLALPICVSPMGLLKYAHEEGETGIAKACASKGTLQALSGWSHTSLEEVKEKSNALLWLNVVIFKERSKTMSLIKRAESAGYTGLVLTCNLSAVGNRRGTDYTTFKMPWAHFTREEEPFFHHGDPSVTWKDLEIICNATKLPVIVKGINTGTEALQALKHGAKAILVSNHGGRQLDSSPAALECLEDVISAVKGKCDVYMDGGIRNGNDVFKALAFGAKAVFIGRPVIWGMAYDGKAGVEKVFDFLGNELKTSMALSGCASIGEITKDKIIKTCDCCGFIAPYSKL